MSDLPLSVRQRLEKALGVQFRESEPIGGGCIANASRIDTTSGEFFLKWSQGDPGKTFEAEAAGLDSMRAVADQLVIPQVHAVEVSTDSEPGFIVMDLLEQGEETDNFWKRLGEGLASMHRIEGPSYGFRQDNFIGRLPQRNGTAPDWPSFFWSQRILPQANHAKSLGRWQSEWDLSLDRLQKRFTDMLPVQPPKSTLHGDLWRGNVLAVRGERAALIDPATYHGDRETDLAMAELFGGFKRPFFDAYFGSWPVEPGYDDRRDVYQLYHLINHLNHFGGSYAGSVTQILRKF